MRGVASAAPPSFMEWRLKLIAKKPLRYAGRSLVAGDEFEASRMDARLLKAIGKAVDAPEREDAPVKVEAERAPASKGKYRTRRMKASDDATEVVGGVPDDDEVSDTADEE